MVACTNEDAPVNGENNKFDGEKAYLAVNIVTSDVFISLMLMVLLIPILLLQKMQTIMKLILL